MSEISAFRGDYTGLTDAEAARRQAEFGRNEITPEVKGSFLKKVISIFKEPMFLLLFGTAALYFLLGQIKDGMIMLVFVVFIAGISIYQEWKTDKTLQALKDLSSPKTRVIRNGRIEEIDSPDIVVGDLVILEEGEKVPADGRIIEMRDLGVDESSLTGESDVVWKKTALNESEEREHWRKDTCFAGTTVTQGSAIIEITAIGINTEYGRIGTAIAEAPDRPTPLEKQTRQLVKAASVFSLIMFLLVLFVTYQHTKNVVDALLSGITLAMATIPEEFPVILTVFLSLGAWRLARKYALIRRLPSVETLGAVTVLCVDKTGTLTVNQMTVQEVTDCGNGLDTRDVLQWAVLACESEPYDPMEKAILAYASDSGVDSGELFSNELVHEYPFSSETKMMGHVWRIGDDMVLAAKGSPESILPLCDMDDVERDRVGQVQSELAGRGHRVIAVARRVGMAEVPPELRNNRLEFMGLIGLADPPREAVPHAVDVCRTAGIRVVMITGDNGATAQAIAAQIGIPHSENVITGQQLDEMTDLELCRRVETTNIFARVIPRHKMRIVTALKCNGEIVAMTGDGVNDAPALKYADIGIAMGQRGTAVAREAADMVLLDDNFTTIVDTVKDGRRIYDNIRKAIEYVVVIHIPIAMAALLAPLMHLPLMLLPVHIVLLELIIDPTCSIVFERQPAEPDIMDRKPRPVHEPLVVGGMLGKAIVQGLMILAASFGSFVFLLNTGHSAAYARSFGLAVLVLSNIFLIYVNQSESSLAIKAIAAVAKDRVLWYINAGVLIGLAAIIYLPQAHSIAKTTDLDLPSLLSAFVIAGAATLWWDLVKVVKLVGGTR